MTRRTLLLALAALLLPAPAAAQHREPIDWELAGADSATVSAFVRRLQTAVRRGDRAAVARMVAYPLDAWVADRQCLLRIPDERALVAAYPRIFGPRARASVAAVNRDSLHGRWDGFMFNNHHIWFRRGDGERAPLRIVAINTVVPVRDPSRPCPAPARR